SGEGEAVNTVVSVPISGGGELDSGSVLAAGHDFYSSPRLSPDGRWLAFLAWDHPNMPWVGTGLYVLQLNKAGSPVGTPVLIAGGERESIFQPEWSPDRSGWWNIYRQPNRAPVEAMTSMEAEFGQPAWVFGFSTYAFLGTDKLVCSYVSKGLGHLATIDLATRELTDIDVPYNEFAYVRASKTRIAFNGGSAVS